MRYTARFDDGTIIQFRLEQFRNDSQKIAHHCKGTPTSAFNGESEFRLRLRGGQPLPRLPEHFHYGLANFANHLGSALGVMSG